MFSGKHPQGFWQWWLCTGLAGIPVQSSTLATLKGHVIAIGGKDATYKYMGAIHCYDAVVNSWTIVSEMPTPRSDALSIVLPGNKLVVVGGPSESSVCTIEIGTLVI